MPPVSLAILWHQHQPYYPDDVADEVLMPWVRLHGTKDYIGMALHLEEVPEFQCTINLVPSLLVQIERYVAGGSDRHLDVSRLPADDLSESDAEYLLDNFFMANAETMIRPFPRYNELYQKRAIHIDSASRAASRFTPQDIRDLQVWNNLTWFHELLFEQDVDLRELRAKGRGFNESEKKWLLERQREVLGEIIPLHSKLARRGQIELTTTPFYHPILPLLMDKRSARQAMPQCDLPRHLESYPDDMAEHLTQAVSYHERLFGEKPLGMWPSEGSVSQAIIPAIAAAGIQWIATDEEILAQSTGGIVGRDSLGHAMHPDRLFQPWRLEEQGHSLQIVFRDHALSDQIGFHYQRSDPVWSARDLLERVKSIGRSVERVRADRPALVPIILDGENCWEHFPDGGVTFLRTLYREAVQQPECSPVRVRDHLALHPASEKIGQLFAGSWIFHDFAIWIGHREDRDAWDLLHETRQFVVEAQRRLGVNHESVKRAWREIYIAEGSDWYWWYGEDHSSPLDALFDQLFRKHLQNVYLVLGESPPVVLSKPITKSRPKIPHTQPRGFLKVHIDGNPSYIEWLNAGKYTAGSERGTMTLVAQGLIKSLYFGFDFTNLYLRLDTFGEAKKDLAAIDEVRLRFISPPDTDVVITNLLGHATTAHVVHESVRSPAEGIECVINRSLEMRMPLNLISRQIGDALQFYVELIDDRFSRDRAPSEGYVHLSTPSPDFERRLWQV
jgi:alpha-amylase/alpha-mannosidase (GH57 family)